MYLTHAHTHTHTWLMDADPTGCVRFKLLNSSSTGTSSSLDSTVDTRLAGMGGTSSWSLLSVAGRCDSNISHVYAKGEGSTTPTACSIGNTHNEGGGRTKIHVVTTGGYRQKNYLKHAPRMCLTFTLVGTEEQGQRSWRENIACNLVQHHRNAYANAQLSTAKW